MDEAEKDKAMEGINDLVEIIKKFAIDECKRRKLPESSLPCAVFYAYQELFQDNVTSCVNTTGMDVALTYIGLHMAIIQNFVKMSNAANDEIEALIKELKNNTANDGKKKRK